jgi:uncharacterized membrane protein
MNIAQDNDCIIILHHRPGDFLVQDMVLCEVLCNEEFNKKVYEKIQDDFIIGKVRTPLQDAEYSIHQMVEVAARALSSGVNDPYTAIACIDNLTSVMCYLTGVEFPSPYRYDTQGKLRVIAGNYTFSGMLNVAFNQIRQYAERNPSVMIRLMEAMNTISTFARNKNQQELIIQHAEMIMHAAEKTFSEKCDLEDIKKRFKPLKEKGYRMNKRKLVVIGGDAAGMTAASKVRREQPEMKIIVFERGNIPPTLLMWNALLYRRAG